MDYIKGALALLFFPLWLGSMLYVALAEKDAEPVERQESSEKNNTERVDRQEASREGQHQAPIEMKRKKRKRGRLR